MRRGARYLLLLATALTALGVFGQWRSHTLAAEAGHRLTGLQQAAASFAESFAVEHQDHELRLMDERRALLVGATRWRTGGLLSLCLAGVALFAAWLTREVRAWVVLGEEAGSRSSAH